MYKIQYTFLVLSSLVFSYLKQFRQCVCIRKNTARSRDHFCNGKEKMRSVYIVELQSTVNSKKILNVAKQFLQGEIYVAGNSKTYLGLRLMYPTFLV